MSGWVGVDLDGTLAMQVDALPSPQIGPPVPRMVQRVQVWLGAGEDVRIVTARVADDPFGIQKRAVENWCRTYVGRVLPVTCCKDPSMKALWDDRAVGVIRNTGMRADHAD